MSHAIFSGIPVVAIGLALSVELKVAVAMIGHEEQLFRLIGFRKAPVRMRYVVSHSGKRPGERYCFWRFSLLYLASGS